MGREGWLLNERPWRIASTGMKSWVGPMVFVDMGAGRQSPALLKTRQRLRREGRGVLEELVRSGWRRQNLSGVLLLMTERATDRAVPDRLIGSPPAQESGGGGGSKTGFKTSGSGERRVFLHPDGHAGNRPLLPRREVVFFLSKRSSRHRTNA